MAPQSNESKPMYQRDEKVLCFHGELLYEAKITDLRRTDSKDPKSPHEYKVHYKGWKNSWDDWVSQDRLRKLTDDNRELAANLRRDATAAAQKALPKTLAKSRRGQGSEIGSGRGSEERTSSVPAGGRGSKRVRDNEIEKVRGDSPSHKRSRMNKLPRDNRKSLGNLPLLNNVRDPVYLLPGWDYLKNATGQTLDTGTGAARTPTVSSVTPNFLDLDEEEMGDTASMNDNNSVNTGPAAQQQEDNAADMRQFVHVPRRAAVKAASAITKTKSRKPAVNNPTSNTTKKRKASDMDDFTTGQKLSARASRSRSRKVSNDLSDTSLPTSQRREPIAKKARMAGGNGTAHVAKRSSRVGEDSKVARTSGRGRSASYAASRRSKSPSSESPASDGLFSVSDMEDEEIPESEYEDSEDEALDSVKKSVRRTSAAMPKEKSTSIEKSTTVKGRLTRSASVSSQPVKTRRSLRNATTTVMKTRARPLRSGTKATLSAPQSLIRPWMIKDTKKYTSADVNRLLAQRAPQDDPEFISNQTVNWETKLQAAAEDSEFRIFNAPLIGGTTTDEKNAIDEEVDVDGELYALQHLGPAKRLPQQYEENPSDIALSFDEQKKTYTRVASALKEPIDVDPPGSNTPFDALKFPNSLLVKVNRSGKKFPDGWDDEVIKLIPSWCLEYTRKDLLAMLPYSLLWDRPWKVLKKLPDNALFWDEWEQQDGVKIIKTFIAKAKGTKATEINALLELAYVATESASPSASKAKQTLGFAAPNDFRFEGCKPCAKYGVKCDGVKPVCNWCMKTGRECKFSDADIKECEGESYIRSGSVYDRQQEFANMGAKNLDSTLCARIPANQEPVGLDYLALAAEVVESGRTKRVQANLAKANTQLDRNLGPGSLSASRRNQDTMQLRARRPGFIAHDIDLEQDGANTYMVMKPQEDNFYARPSIRINVPDHLKNLLVDDWENVTKSLLLVPLPSQAPANYIIDEYFSEEKMNRRLGSTEADVLEEFCAGLKTYFEKAVGKILLYRFERSQLAEVRKLWESGKYKEWDDKGPGDCYGAEHLTRMIVNLPEMIAQTNMDPDHVARLKTELSKFSTWLSRNSAKYFCAKYEKPSAEYIEHAR